MYYQTQHPVATQYPQATYQQTGYPGAYYHALAQPPPYTPMQRQEVPIYLVKEKLHTGGIVSFASSRTREMDTAHWALEIRGQYFQLSKYFFKGFELTQAPIVYENIIFRQEVGRTNFSNEEIMNAGKWVVSWMRLNFKKYNALSANCQAFVNFLWHYIITNNTSNQDLLGLPFNAFRGIDYGSEEKEPARKGIRALVSAAFLAGNATGAVLGNGGGVFGRLVAVGTGALSCVTTAVDLIKAIRQELRPESTTSKGVYKNEMDEFLVDAKGYTFPRDAGSWERIHYRY